MNQFQLPIINRETDTVILANGDFPLHPIPLSILQASKYLVCCDGAINNLSHIDKKPHAIVGDCDSLSDENRIRYADIIHRIAEQETNDLTKAVHFCMNGNKRKITILGATGKREDHTIANISLLCEYMREADVEIITDYGIFVAIDKMTILESYAKQQVSLFCIDTCKITTTGLVYPIVNQTLTNWWQASLNEAIGNFFSIDTTGKVLVYRAF